MRSTWDSHHEHFERRTTTPDNEHPRAVIWGLLEPILQELLSDPNYVKGLITFTAKEFWETFQYGPNQAFHDAINILFKRRPVLLWNLCTLFTHKDYNNTCCTDCEYFSCSVRQHYGPLLMKSHSLKNIFIDDPKDTHRREVVDFQTFLMRRYNPTPEANGDRTTMCEDAQEFWWNLRMTIAKAMDQQRSNS
ncbi:hypothetical protein BZA77DRAFT_356888 [Pyronema omphalodes]|nr:hypothetical protein BZA77DRAFT_357591 [Pyronema omphalodes]KAI5814350.1 hypothetical protein BZA77DRAFT_356888 [Pyronema omphalodes]